MNLSVDEKNILDDTANEPRDELLVALDAYSIEIGLNEAGSLDALADRLAIGTRIFLNMMPKDDIGDRIRVCQQIASLGMSPVPHIAARLVDRMRNVNEMLERFVQQGGVSEFLVIAGDYNQASGEIEDALALIEAIDGANNGIQSIGIAGYPEGHPQISDEILDKALDDKIAALQTRDIKPYIVTQFSFNADAIVAWSEKIHAGHPDIVIRIGVPGPAKLTTLIRFAQRCGVVSSMKKLKGLPVSSSLKLMQRVPPLNQTMAIGNYKITQNDNATIHFFTFGGLEASIEWIRSEVAERSAPLP